jgi:hypothetical protein
VVDVAVGGYFIMIGNEFPDFQKVFLGVAR